MAELTLKVLQDAVAGTAAAFRCVTEYQPAGGAGDKVFPPTYADDKAPGKHAWEERRVAGKEKPVPCVLLDSVQSQANRMELALLEAWEDKRIELPVIVVDFAGNNLERDLRITSLEAPHRIADAILRDSLTEDGTRFRKSELGKRLDNVDYRNATLLFELCPTSLLFGMWDSTGPKKALGAKFSRVIVSEIVGINAQVGLRTGSRIDPTAIRKNAGPVYRTPDGSLTLDPVEALDEFDKKGKPTGKKILFGKRKGADIAHDPKSESFPDEGRPSVANHGNVTPSLTVSGVTIDKAIQTTVLSLTGVRRLRFPLNSGSKPDPIADAAGRTVLAALGLCASTLAREQGCDLRSRCQLFATQESKWELLDHPGAKKHQEFQIDGSQGSKLLADAVKAARGAGLKWPVEPLPLTPASDLVELVRRSQQLAAQDSGDE